MSRLSQAQLKAIALIAEGETPPSAAKKVGVSYRTLQRWFQKSEFQTALEEVRAKTASKFLEKVSDLSSERFTVNLRQLQSEHLESYRRMRKITEAALTHFEQKMAQQAFEDCHPRALDIWMKILDRSLRGEAETAFMRNLDLDTALCSVMRAGYAVYSEAETPRVKVEMGDLEIATTFN